MVDLFACLREFPSVARVSNLYNLSLPLNLMLFLCPKMSNKGLRLNQVRTGLTVTYQDGPAKSTKERATKLDKFLEEALAREVQVSVQGIFAAADALTLFPIPQPLPLSYARESQMLMRIGLVRRVGITLNTNVELVERHHALFAQFYEEEPWRTVPQCIRLQEEERLRKILPEEAPDYVSADFIRRTFAGFALDGVLLRRGMWGRNPVILGVESPGVAVLQNTALPRGEWIPVVQLR